MGLIVKAFRIITAFNVHSMKAVRFLILVMMLSMLCEVVARYAFNKPTIWSYELTGMILGPMQLFGAVYVMARNEHIRLDLLYKRLSLRTQGMLDSITWLFFFFYVGLVMYFGWESSLFSFTITERSKSLWHPILWPWKIAIPISCFLLLLQGLVTYGRAIHKAITGRELV